MKREDILKDLELVFRDVFDDDCLKIFDDMNAEDIEDWDSLAQVNLIVAIENNFNIKVNIEEVMKFQNVGQMIDSIYNKRNDGK